VPVTDHNPFELLGDVCAQWAANARDRVRTIGPRGDTALIDEGAELLESLPRESSHHVLLHGDFHHWNVLSSLREPWLAIDAKPMVGDPVFDCAQFLGNHHGITGGRDAFVRGVDVFADATGFDRARMLLWVLAKTAADAMWASTVDDPYMSAGILEYARFVKTLGTRRGRR
jgi:streptomycin 6-kinase